MRIGIGIWLGAFIVLLGVSIILDAVFHIHVPLVRIGIALLLIFLGVRMLAGPWEPATRREEVTVGTESTSAPTSAATPLKYDVIFGRRIVDLTGLQRTEGTAVVEVSTVFGASVVKVDPRTPIEVEASTVFGDARMPDGNMAAFGSIRYRPRGQEGLAPRIRLKLNVVFGSARVQESGATEVGAAPLGRQVTPPPSSAS